MFHALLLRSDQVSNSAWISVHGFPATFRQEMWTKSDMEEWGGTIPRSFYPIKKTMSFVPTIIGKEFPQNFCNLRIDWFFFKPIE